MHESDPVGLPARAALGPDALHLELLDIAPELLIDPFMQGTVKRVAARAVRIAIPKSDLGRDAPGSAPAGLIFHVARCGSTLASQLLKLHDRAVVYSEPLPFNNLLVPPHKWNRAELILALRSLGAHFARHAKKPYVLKLTSWNTLFCELLAEAFPATPWALCIRDPVEVCVSLLHRPPGWLRDPELFAGIVDPDRVARTPEEYAALLFAGFCSAARRLDAGRGALVAYEALPQAVWNVLGPHFGLSIGDNLRDRMNAASRTYSKAAPDKPAAFIPDDEKKRAAASPALLQAIEAYARPEFAWLLESSPDGRSLGR
jgi:hypothetical protein